MGILAHDSFFKLTKSSGNDDEGNFLFYLKLANFLRDIEVSGELSYAFSDDTVVLTLFSKDGDTIADLEVPSGSSKCMSIFSIDLCSSWEEETSMQSRRLSDKVPVKLYLRVDGEETESI